MSSKARRAEKKAEWEAQCSAEEEERRRKDNLAMYWRIDEADCSDDVKDILRRIAEFAGMDLYDE